MHPFIFYHCFSCTQGGEGASGAWSRGLGAKAGLHLGEVGSLSQGLWEEGGEPEPTQKGPRARSWNLHPCCCVVMVLTAAPLCRHFPQSYSSLQEFSLSFSLLAYQQGLSLFRWPMETQQRSAFMFTGRSPYSFGSGRVEVGGGNVPLVVDTKIRCSWLVMGQKTDFGLSAFLYFLQGLSPRDIPATSNPVNG